MGRMIEVTVHLAMEVGGGRFVRIVWLVGVGGRCYSGDVMWYVVAIIYEDGVSWRGLGEFR